MSSSAHGDGRAGPAPTATYFPLRPAPVVLVIGYPAPAAVQIVERLLTTGARPVTCVVSRDRWAEASQMHRGAQDRGRLRLLEGRADAPGLGLAGAARWLLGTTEEIHAVASARAIAAGHVHDFADECPRLRGLHVAALGPAFSPRSTWDAPARTARRALTVSRRAVRTVRDAPFVRAARSWRPLMSMDLDVALSQDDLEQDLWPGLCCAL